MAELPPSNEGDLPLLLESPAGSLGELLVCPGAFRMIVRPGWRVLGEAGREYHVEPADGRDFGVSISVLPLGRGDFLKRAEELTRKSASRIVGDRNAVDINVSGSGPDERVSGRMQDATHEWLHDTVKAGRQAVLITGIAPLAHPEWRRELRTMIDSVTPAPRRRRYLRRRRSRG